MSNSQTLLKDSSKRILKGAWALLKMDDSENTWNKQFSVRRVSKRVIQVPTKKGCSSIRKVVASGCLGKNASVGTVPDTRKDCDQILRAGCWFFGVFFKCIIFLKA